MTDCAGLTLGFFFFLPLLRLLLPFEDMTDVYMMHQIKKTNVYMTKKKKKQFNLWESSLYRRGTGNYPVYQCCRVAKNM